MPQSLRGASRVVVPEHAAVANAVGAAVALVGGEVERIVSYADGDRDGVPAVNWNGKPRPLRLRPVQILRHCGLSTSMRPS